MEKIIAGCGLICNECPAYKATIANDDELRKSTAEMWNKYYGANVTYKDINCLGCKDDEHIYVHCKQCKIKNCNNEKGISNCGECDSYPCDEITAFIKGAPMAKDVLDEIHNTKFNQ